MGKCYNSIVVNAPVQKVWSTLRDFHNLDWAAGVIDKLEAGKDKEADQVGAKRILNGVFFETLLSLDDDDRAFSYSIDDGPPPLERGSVKDYIGSVRATAVTENDTTFVEWQSSFESPDDKAVGEFCNPIYRGFLAALKKHFA